MFKKIFMHKSPAWICRYLLIGIAALSSLATTASGQLLFVANSANGTIGEYDATSGAAINPALISGLRDPMGIAICGQDLFVANNGNGTIGEYALSGQTINASLISGLTGPTDVTISQSNLFVSSYVDYGSGFGIASIGEYTTSGSIVNATLIPAVPSYGITVAGSDLFVSHFGTASSGSVNVFDANGTLLNSFGAVLPPYIWLAEPTEIAVSGSDVFVADTGAYTIAEFTTSGALVQSIEDYDIPVGIATYGSDIFVTNSDGTVSEYTTSGDLVNDSLISGLGTGDPWGIAVVLPEPGAPGVFGVLMLQGLARRRLPEYDSQQ